MFIHNGMETRKNIDGDAVVLYGIEIFMLFSFIWDVCVVVDIVGHMMTMWQGSYQVKCGRWKSRYGAARR